MPPELFWFRGRLQVERGEWWGALITLVLEGLLPAEKDKVPPSLGTEGRTGREHLTFQFYYMGNHLLTSLNPGFYLQGYWTPGFFSVQHFFSRLLMDVVQHL